MKLGKHLQEKYFSHTKLFWKYIKISYIEKWKFQQTKMGIL